MSEQLAVAATPAPRTRESLVADLRALGVTAGGALMVHSAMRTLGWVAGGAPAVILALCDAVTPAGTLVMPAHSTQLTDPASWCDPPIPEAWHAAVRASLPAWDPRTTPTRGMGTVAEQFRTWPAVCRSPHPALSFTALGPLAGRITCEQVLEDPFGERSPLARLCEMNAQVILLGVGFNRCTALHLAERRVWPDRATVEAGAPLLVNGRREWVRYRAAPLDDSGFAAAGDMLLRLGLARTGMVGSALCHILPMRAAIEAVIEFWRAG